MNIVKRTKIWALSHVSLLVLAFALSACETTAPYEICHTDNCGDGVPITVEK